MSTSTLGQLVPGFESQQGRSALLRDSGTCLGACGFDQLSQETPVRFRVPVVDQLSRVTPTLVRRTALSNRCSG